MQITLVRSELVSGHGASSTPTAEYLMIFTSFILLCPYWYAQRAGRSWHAALFATMAFVCAAYHVCDAKESRLGAYCPQPMPHVLTLADHGCAYFCFVQMALLLLGPEDHNLQWQTGAALSTPWRTVPNTIAIHSRAIPLTAVLAFLVLYPDWRKFHYQMAFLCCAAVLNGTLQFWFSQREHAPKVLCHSAFWKRIITLGLIPLVICLAVFNFMENAHVGSEFAHAAWHGLVAMLALNVQRTVYNSLPDPLHVVLETCLWREAIADIHCTTEKNPPVSSYLLGSISCSAGLTILAGRMQQLMLPTGHHNWPIMVVDELQWQVCYILSIGMLFILVSFMGTLSLIANAPLVAESNYERQLQGRYLGSSFGYASAFFCLFGLLAMRVGTPLMCAVFRAASVLTAAISVCSITFSEPWDKNLEYSNVTLVRRLIASLTSLATVLLIASLVVLEYSGGLEKDRISTASGARQVLAFSEYSVAALLSTFPWTYADQVHKKWAMQCTLNLKAPRGRVPVAGVEF